MPPPQPIPDRDPVTAPEGYEQIRVRAPRAGIPEAPVPYALTEAPEVINGLLDTTSLQLPDDTRGDGPLQMRPVPGDPEIDPWTSAIDKARNLRNYMTNSLYTAGKANTFRREMVDRLRQIYWRIKSLQAKAENIGEVARGANEAQRALIGLVNLINESGGVTQQQAESMATLADQLSQINIPHMISALATEINALSGQLNLTDADRIANDNVSAPTMNINPPPVVGGRKRKTKRKRKKRKGGFKFTRMANSKRSLRMATRKKKSYKGYKHKKYKRRKHKRTKHKRTKRKRKR